MCKHWFYHQWDILFLQTALLESVWLAKSCGKNYFWFRTRRNCDSFKLFWAGSIGKLPSHPHKPGAEKLMQTKHSLKVQIPFFRCFSLLERCEWAAPWPLCYSGCHLADNCYLLYFPQSLCASPFTGVRTGVRCQLSPSFRVKGVLFFIQLLPPGHAFRWPALPSHSLLEPWMSHAWGTANSHATSRRAREAESFLTFTTVRSLHKQFLRMKWMASL